MYSLFLNKQKLHDSLFLILLKSFSPVDRQHCSSPLMVMSIALAQFSLLSPSLHQVRLKHVSATLAAMSTYVK